MDRATEFVRKRLFELTDEKYRTFNSKLIPTVNPEVIIGVRTPELRRFARELSATPMAQEFIDSLPHEYYEENNVHAFLIELTKDYDLCVERLNKFLPFVDNWATCDMMSPKVFKKNLPLLSEQIRVWLKSGDTYTIRFAIRMLMSFFLDEHFSPEYPELVAGVKTDEYYLSMMVAWYFATALAKQYEAVLPYFEGRILDKATHNRAIQKAVESYRITPEQKAYLKTLKIK